MDFKSILAKWYGVYKRDLPWRYTSDPYQIWVSEIILQQTRVAQGIGYYKRFISTFPTVFDLANAHEDQVLKVWQGLGYYTRARNMHSAAKRIVSDFGGVMPCTYEDLLKVKGIGIYSAGAIASFAFKLPVPAIDGNVYRIMARIFGVFSLPTTSSGKKEFFQLVLDLMDKESPDSFNQALLDFGALQCVPRNPKCTDCPFMEYCYAFRNNMVDSLPSKGKKLIPRDRFFTYLLIRHGKMTFIAKRKANDIWHSLYEFPLIETNQSLELREFTQMEEWQRLIGKSKHTISYISPLVKHQLSHQTIYTRFLVVEVSNVSNYLKKEYMMVSTNELDSYSTPRLIDNFLAAEPATKYFLNPPQ
ncbi:MAG: A/G-specific adenine glycosylase [Tenuifilaceae bacterium]|jgi:A/G-specific adenine glycosylase|nr:A/G-specific adenine glycosylase [Tenuifilaceae bacterium]